MAVVAIETTDLDKEIIVMIADHHLASSATSVARKAIWLGTVPNQEPIT